MIPTLKRVAVIDVVERKILNLVSADDDKVRVAAGATTFVVSLGTKGTLSRYSLPSCERELTVVAPPQEIIDLEMGCNSEGPVYALSKGTSGSLPIYFDLKNLKPFAVKEENRDYRAYGYDLACSADGWFFSSGTVQAQLVGDRVQFIPNERRDGYTEGTVLPSADGRVVYGCGGMWKVGGERIGDDEYKAYHIPADAGPLFARITAARIRTKPADPTLHLQGQNQSLLTIDDVDVWGSDGVSSSRCRKTRRRCPRCHSRRIGSLECKVHPALRCLECRLESIVRIRTKPQNMQGRMLHGQVLARFRKNVGSFPEEDA